MFAEPSVIANVGDSATTQRHTGSSFTLSGRGKRKRSELVLGTDSSGIEIFDARSRNSRGLTSHGIPPGELFLCPPVSVVVKRSDSQTQERFTYWATYSSRGKSQDHTRLPKVKITCLKENSKDSTTTAATLGSTQDPISTIKALEIIPSDEHSKSKSRESHSILAVHSDCSVTLLSADLQRTVFEAQLTGTSSSEDTIEFATTVSLEDARQSLLKAREDVIVDLPSSGSLLASVIRDGSGDSRMSYFSLTPRPNALYSLQLPGSENAWEAGNQIHLHVRTSKLYELRPEQSVPCLYVYDLSGFAVRCEQSMRIPGASSFARVSQHSVAVGLKDSLAIYDVKWKYLQGTIATSSQQTDGPPQIQAFYSSIGAAVAFRGSHLLSYILRDDVNVENRTNKRRRTGGLADAVGQGLPIIESPTSTGQQRIHSESLGRKLVPSVSREASAEIKKRFDPILNAADIKEYDDNMLHALQTVSGSKKGSSIGYAAQPDLIAYAVCGLFDVDSRDASGNDAHLKIRKMAPETFRFLLTHGILTLSQVEKSLRFEGKLPRQRRLAEASVVNALADHDETLQALIYYLSSAPLLSAQELSAALLVCLTTVQRLATKAPTRELEVAKEPTHEPAVNGDVAMINGTSEPDGSHAEFDGDWPDPDPAEGLTHNARSALGSCLTRLSLCSDKEVQKALRVTLSTEETLVLVDYIRMELSSGGWLARYLDADLQGEDDLSAQSNQVNVAAKILNCAIDSLGAATWLLGSGSGSELEASQSADKVTYMQAEINAALEGIENSAFLEHVLHEVLLYAKSAKESDGLLANADIVPVPVGAEGKEAQMLPLGMKKEKVSRTKIGNGGKQVSRSARDVGRLESKKVPEYSFERIMI